MGWLKKILGRKDDHEAWLVSHPGKESTGGAAPAVSEDYERDTRARVEAELDAQRAKRQKS